MKVHLDIGSLFPSKNQPRSGGGVRELMSAIREQSILTGISVADSLRLATELLGSDFFTERQLKSLASRISQLRPMTKPVARHTLVLICAAELMGIVILWEGAPGYLGSPRLGFVPTQHIYDVIERPKGFTKREWISASKRIVEFSRSYLPEINRDLVRD